MKSFYRLATFSLVGLMCACTPASKPKPELPKTVVAPDLVSSALVGGNYDVVPGTEEPSIDCSNIHITGTWMGPRSLITIRSINDRLLGIERAADPEGELSATGLKIYHRLTFQPETCIYSETAVKIEEKKGIRQDVTKPVTHTYRIVEYVPGSVESIILQACADEACEKIYKKKKIERHRVMEYIAPSAMPVMPKDSQTLLQAN